jgi:hypothetical protein
MKSLVRAAAKQARRLGAVLCLGFAPSAVLAADVPAEPVTPPSGWRFQATGYGWGTAIDGEVGVRNLPAVDVGIDFADILKNLDGALMGSFLAQNGDWMILTDLVWAKLSADAHVQPPGLRRPVLAALAPGTQVDFSMRQLIASGIVGYRLPTASRNLELHATAGVRYQRLSARLKAAPGLAPIAISRGSVEDWADPVIGLSAQWRVTDRWFVNAIADIGGFGVGSEFTAQGFASVGYKWTESLSTAVGYRAIYTDYRDGGFLYRTTQHGLFSSIGYHF